MSDRVEPRRPTARWAPATIEVLSEIVAAVNGRAEVLLDSGVRRGIDVVKAASLGAKACLIGRPWVFAVVVAGEAGVAGMLTQLHEEIERALLLVGCLSVRELGLEYVRRRASSVWQRLEPSLFS